MAGHPSCEGAGAGRGAPAAGELGTFYTRTRFRELMMVN
jgi:hypothetical protein